MPTNHIHCVVLSVTKLLYYSGSQSRWDSTSWVTGDLFPHSNLVSFSGCQLLLSHMILKSCFIMLCQKGYAVKVIKMFRPLPISLLKWTIIQYISERRGKNMQQSILSMILRIFMFSYALWLLSDTPFWHLFLFLAFYMESACKFNLNRTMYPFGYRTHAHQLGMQVL